MQDYTEIFKFIKDLIMETSKLSAWRFMAILLMIVVLAFIWRLPEILLALPKILAVFY